MVATLVRDCEGRIRHRVWVTRTEMTCLDCGEVSVEGFCVRCLRDEEGRETGGKNLVKIESYLRNDEFVFVS